MKWFGYLGLFAAFVCCKPQDYTPSYNSSEGLFSVDSSVADNDDVVKIIEPYKQALDAQMNKVIGFAAEEFNNKCDDTRESNLGDFVADLLLEQTKIVVKDSVDLAVINHHGGLRTAIPKGNIVVSNIYELMPFDNEMWVLQVKGNKVQRLFNNAAKRRSNCIAGATFQIVDDSIAQNIIINGKLFDMEKTYNISISDYLAGGGGGHWFFKKLVPTYDPDYKCREMIIDYITENSLENGDTLVPKIDNRIVIVE